MTTIRSHNPARGIARLVRSTAGNAAVEFGVVAPILLTLIAGVADLGLMSNRKVTLDAAVRAGGAYARYDPTDVTTITAAVNSYATFSPAISSVVVTGPFCECDGGGGTSDGTCDGTCATGPVHTYVTVAATQPYSAILPLSALGTLTQVTASVTMRAQ
jgi:Flp pilus assembly protein TadG